MFYVAFAFKKHVTHSETHDIFCLHHYTYESIYIILFSANYIPPPSAIFTLS